MRTSEHLDDLVSATNELQEAWEDQDARRALLACARAQDALGIVAAALVELGVHAGLSQREMARRLKIPEGTLRGARKEFAR